MGAILVGDDQAGVRGHYVNRRVGRNREQQFIAMLAVVRPFLIGAKVGDRGFHLDTDNSRPGVQRDDSRAPPIAQRQFNNGRPALTTQPSARSALDAQSGLRLAAIDKGPIDT